MILLLLLLQLCLAFNPHSSRVCKHSKSFPFTGYKVENQIGVRSRSNNYHLLYCNDNKLIFDFTMEENIPWTKPIRFGRDGNILILARRKSFARREIPLYLPQTLVGAIFTDMSAVANENKGERLKLGSVIPAADTSIPLIAENIIHNWIEVNYKGDLIHHIPILTTPRMDSRKYKYNKEWDHYISVLENYTYDYDSRAWFRQDADIVLLLVNQILERNVKVLGTQDGIFWKLLLISKAVSKESFKRLIIRLNDLMI